MSSASENAIPMYSDIYDFINPQRLRGSLDGKVALVTGASRGIGRAMALALAEAGADVALLARTKSQLESVAEVITNTYGRRALVLVADTTDDDAVSSAVKATEDTLGALDIAIANAGIGGQRPFALTPMAEWWKLMEVNVKGQLLVTQAAMNSMRQKGKGIIICNTSRAAVYDISGASAYCASKAAIVRAVGCIQLEADAEAKDIQLFSIHPGGVRTDLPLGENAIHPDMDLIQPGIYEFYKKSVKNSDRLKDTPKLSAWSCVFLATGAAKELRGKYIDVRYDLGVTLKHIDLVKERKLNELKVQLLESLPE